MWPMCLGRLGVQLFDVGQVVMAALARLYELFKGTTLLQAGMAAILGQRIGLAQGRLACGLFLGQ